MTCQQVQFTLNVAQTFISFQAQGAVSYDPDALQVFNRRAVGGIYWYSAGWNIPATVSWVLGAIVGLLAVSTSVYEGPLLSLTGGVDCSFILSGLTGGIAYLILSRMQPVPAVAPAAAAEPAEAKDDEADKVPAAG